MNFAWLVPVSDEVAEVGSLRHRFDETPLKPAEPSCPFPAVTIKLEGRRAARYALGMGGRGDRQTVAKTGREGGGEGGRKREEEVSARLHGWMRRARLSKGARGGWTRGRGGSRGRWGYDGAASASPAGGSAGAAEFRRGVILRTLPIRS